MSRVQALYPEKGLTPHEAGILLNEEAVFQDVFQGRLDHPLYHGITEAYVFAAETPGEIPAALDMMRELERIPERHANLFDYP